MMIIGEWLERSLLTLLSASHQGDLQIDERPLARLLQIIEQKPTVSDNDNNEPCLVHICDSKQHTVAVLTDTPLARLSRRFSSRPLKSFAGCTLEITRARMQLVADSGAVAVLVVDDFQVVGGMVGGSVSLHGQTPLIQSERVVRALEAYNENNSGLACSVPDSQCAVKDDPELEEIVKRAQAEPVELQKLSNSDEADNVGEGSLEEFITNFMTDVESSGLDTDDLEPTKPESEPSIKIKLFLSQPNSPPPQLQSCPGDVEQDTNRTDDIIDVVQISDNGSESGDDELLKEENLAVTPKKQNLVYTGPLTSPLTTTPDREARIINYSKWF
jgi:hypothetical protein